MKKIIFFLLALCLLTAIAIPASAENNYIFDNDNVLTDSEISLLEQSAASVFERHNLGIHIVTVPNYSGYANLLDYAKNYYNINIGLDNDGIVFALCISSRDYAIDMPSRMDKIISDSKFDALEEATVRLLGKENYAEAFKLFISTVDEYYTEVEQKENILFRGIEWGIPYRDVMKALEKEGLKWRDPSATEGRKIKALAAGKWSDYYDYECQYYTYTYSSSDKLKVAGYDVDTIYIYTAFTENENGRIPQDEAHTAFYMAKYSFKPTDLKAVYADMQNKLTSVYGEPDKYDRNGTIVNYEYTYWYGSNDTMIILTSDDNWETVDISYCWTGGEELMKRANQLLHQAEIEAEAEKFGTNNVDGL